MATLAQAIEIAARAHAGATDKQGNPYILHPLRVMFGVEGAAAQIVAVLHDVVEDTDVTIDDLQTAGFEAEILEALKLVTHDKEQAYSDYVVACSRNEVARQVKLADLRDNASLSRLLLRSDQFERDSLRMHRYVLSYRYLTGELSETDYRRLMADFE